MAPKAKGGKKGKGEPKKGPVKAYGDEEYWNNRYTNEPETFDWYQKYFDIKGLVTKYIPKTARNLVVGCGNAGTILLSMNNPQHH